MKVDDIFPSKYLKSDDVEDRFVRAVIETCEMEAVGDDRRLVIYFQNMKKGLVCNRTNFDNIAVLYGDDTDNWPGGEVVIYTEMTRYQGKSTLGIRVRGPERKAPAARVQNDVRPAPSRPRPSGNFVVDPPAPPDQEKWPDR